MASEPERDGGGALAWVLLRSAMILGKRDINALEDVAPVDSGDNIRFRATSSTNHDGFDGGVSYLIPLPAELLDGMNKQLRVRLTFDSAPSTPWGVSLGVYGTSPVWGIAAGARWVNSTGKMAAANVKNDNLFTGGSCTATALELTGHLLLDGDFDGIESISAGSISNLSDAANNISAAAGLATGTSTKNAANTSLAINLSHINSGFSDVLDALVKLEYSNTRSSRLVFRWRLIPRISFGSPGRGPLDPINCRPAA